MILRLTAPDGVSARWLGRSRWSVVLVALWCAGIGLLGSYLVVFGSTMKALSSEARDGSWNLRIDCDSGSDAGSLLQSGGGGESVVSVDGEVVRVSPGLRQAVHVGGPEGSYTADAVAMAGEFPQERRVVTDGDTRGIPGPGGVGLESRPARRVGVGTGDTLRIDHAGRWRDLRVDFSTLR